MPAVEHIQAIERLVPKTLIDVGANKGQFSVVARHLFPQIDIYAFEPLETERMRFKEVVGGSVNLFSVALGSKTGSARFHVTSRLDSSSLFVPGQGQKQAYGVEAVSSIAVEVACLSDVIDENRLARPVLLKLDVQGAELDVLRGAEPMLDAIDYIYCETSFLPLYDQQPLANDLAFYLISQGFHMSGVFNQSETKVFGPTQADFLWQRGASR
jgi:FkbM family methyltransferase